MQFFIGVLLVAFIIFLAWDMIKDYRKNKKIIWKSKMLEVGGIVLLVFILVRMMFFKF